MVDGFRSVVGRLFLGTESSSDGGLISSFLRLLHPVLGFVAFAMIRDIGTHSPVRLDALPAHHLLPVLLACLWR